MRRLFALLSALLLTSFVPKEKEYYFLSVTTTNHANSAVWGSTIYQVRDGHIIVTKSIAPEAQDLLLLFKPIRPVAVKKLQKINIYGLDTVYVNKCTPSKKGRDFMISLEEAKTDKDIRLHDYYNPRIAQLIAELNNNVPGKLKIKYTPADFKQDCN